MIMYLTAMIGCFIMSELAFMQQRNIMAWIWTVSGFGLFVLGFFANDVVTVIV